MVKLEIKDISLMADETDLETFKPKGAFLLVFNVDIGFIGKEGSDEFRFSVCNKEWLAEYLLEKENHAFLNNYNMMVVKEYSYKKVLSAINDILANVDLSSSNSKSWASTALNINQYFRWEYFDEFLENPKKFINS